MDSKHLLAALHQITAMPPKSMLEDCAYQGPPPKKWVKQMSPRYEGYNECLEIVQKLARAAIAATKGTSR